MTSNRFWRNSVVAALVALSLSARAEIEIVLKKEFIEKYMNRVTIDAQFTVDKAHPRPNPGSKDGDLHIAGRAPEIGLAAVAEIMNAKSESAAMDTIHNAEGTGTAVPISGAWRIWCEHGGDLEHVQGKSLSAFTTTNPDHVFEIHPVSRIADESVTKSFKPIPGFTTKDAHDAFVKYEGIPCRLSVDGDKTRILTTMAGFNYVEFILELSDEPRAVSDGTMVFANVRDLEGELLVRKRRMVMVKDSPPEKVIKEKHANDRVHVLGVPRMDLALVAWRTDHASDPREPLKWHLPYEMIIVATYSASDELP